MVGGEKLVDEIETQVGADLKRAAHLRQSILKRAFEGQLVPQDPNDEPANKLLERIRQQRQGAAASCEPADKRCSPLVWPGSGRTLFNDA